MEMGALRPRRAAESLTGEIGMATNRQKKNSDSDDSSGQQKSGSSDFPKHLLEQAVQLPLALEEKNGGNPLSPMDLAIALGRGPASSDFRVLLSSSFKYGLTGGTHTQPRVSLQELGRDIAQPKSDKDKGRALVEAALKPPLFRSVYEHYRGKRLPDPHFLRNVLIREFGIVPGSAELFAQIFIANLQYVGLVKEAATGKFVGSAEAPEIIASTESLAGPPMHSSGPDPADAAEEPSSTAQVPMSPPPKSRPNSAIFLGHGKNREPLRQLAQFLTEYGISHKVAVDEANEARPISQKVADTMKECGAAIIIFTADEEFRDSAGNTVFRPSENAVFELGAASVLYGSRIVIFREAGVAFPANFRDIGHIEFEKNQLLAKAPELFRELISFGLIKVSVAG
jgi:predicted nucleotide-binding protein